MLIDDDLAFLRDLPVGDDDRARLAPIVERLGATRNLVLGALAEADRPEDTARDLREVWTLGCVGFRSRKVEPGVVVDQVRSRRR